MNKKRFTLFFWIFLLLIFVPLIGAAGLQDEAAEQVSAPDKQTDDLTLPELIYASSEHFSDIDSVNLDGLLNRIGDSRLVLLGEATHGTAEFYDMRARITRELIEKKGFNIVAVEADWPDAASIDFFIREPGHNPGRNPGHKPMFKNDLFSDTWFSGFPTWMWANHSVLAFVHWLKDYNRSFSSAEDTVGFYGLDLYNMFASIEAVLDYLQDVDPKMAEVASWHYGCLNPWVNDPSIYSRVMQSRRFRGCGYEVFTVMQNLHKKRKFYRHQDQQRFFSAVQNARLVRNAERYYRTMYDDSTDSWNQRDQNMFETLQAVLVHRGQTSKAVVWAHNSHIGDARATEVSARGEFNLGQRVRETFGDSAYLIGFGTDHGTVAAASEWEGPMQVMQVRPSHEDSYERLCHDAKTDDFLLPLRNTNSRKPMQDITRKKLLAKRLQRAIGVTYDPEDELNKHYFYASLPRQFDEYIWFDETQTVKPLKAVNNE